MVNRLVSSERQNSCAFQVRITEFGGHPPLLSALAAVSYFRLDQSKTWHPGPLTNHMYSLDEYLDLEDESEFKHEFHAGHVVAMAAGTEIHSRLSLRTDAVLDRHLTRCRTYDRNLKLFVEQANRIFYPDAMVLCGEPRFVKGRNTVIDNPTVVVEVISPSSVTGNAPEQSSPCCSTLRELGPLVDIKAQSAGHNVSLGITLIMLGFFCSAVMSTFSKEAVGVPPLLTLFLQYGISFLVFVPSAIASGRTGLKTDHFRLQLFRSVAGAVCQLLFFIAVKSIPLLDSVLLSNAAPLFIPIVVYIWFRKTVQPLVWLSLFIGLVGIVLIIKPGPQMFQNPASLIALVAGMVSAIALVSTNKLAETEPPTRILIYNFGLSTLLLIPFCIGVWRPLSSRQWLLLLGVGLFYAATQYFIILAYRYASATELSPFNYTVVIFSGILGWLFFGNVPGLTALAGTVLICAGGILSILAGHSEGLGHMFGNGHWSMYWKFRHRKTVEPVA